MKSEWKGKRVRDTTARPCLRTLVSRLPQVLPAKVAATEFAFILSMVAGTIVATAFRIAVIYAAVKPESSGVAVLFVSNGAKWNAFLFPRLFVAQNSVVFFAANLGAFKPDELVFFRMINNHAMNRVNVLVNMHLHDFIFLV